MLYLLLCHVVCINGLVTVLFHVHEEARGQRPLYAEAVWFSYSVIPCPHFQTMLRASVCLRLVMCVLSLDLSCVCYP